MKNIAVLKGGYSFEKDISIRSGAVIESHLHPNQYRVYGIFITEDNWYYQDKRGTPYPVNKDDFTIMLNGEKISFDCCYNTVHGTPGEDGFLQAYLELLNIPHTSSNFYASAITFNKRDCLAVLKPWSIPTGLHIYKNRGDDVDLSQIINRVGLPCFVKANRSGSSVGVTKVYDMQQLPEALSTAYKIDEEIIIESFLDGTEVSVGVYQIGDQILALPPTEIISENDFFDYDAKYNGKSQEITPARITDAQSKNVQDLSKSVYSILKLKGLARADFIFHNDQPHFIEINTTPGMTDESIVPQQVRAARLNLQDILTDIIEDTIKKHS